MGVDLTEADHMSFEEIRYRHNVRGVSVRVLAELNACSDTTIEKILSGKKVHWGTTRPRHCVVNVDEGIFYGSVKECEVREGIKKGSLTTAFQKRGSRIVFKGTRYHRY